VYLLITYCTRRHTAHPHETHTEATSKLTIAQTVLVVVCTIPQAVTYATQIFAPHRRDIIVALVLVAILCTVISVSVNIIIYIISSEQFRRFLWNALTCKKETVKSDAAPTTFTQRIIRTASHAVRRKNPAASANSVHPPATATSRLGIGERIGSAVSSVSNW
jgi:hypothetical protein